MPLFNMSNVGLHTLPMRLLYDIIQAPVNLFLRFNRELRVEFKTLVAEKLPRAMLLREISTPCKTSKTAL